MSYFNHKEYSERCFSDKKKEKDYGSNMLQAAYDITDNYIKDHNLKVSKKERDEYVTHAANAGIDKARKLVGGTFAVGGAGLGAGLAYGGSKATQAILAKKYKKSGLSEAEAKKKAKEIVKAGKISLAGAGIGGLVGGRVGSDKKMLRAAFKNKYNQSVGKKDVNRKDMDRDDWALPD